MSKWNHLLCEACWNDRNPGRKAVIVPSSSIDRCCVCGQPTGSGIYVRANPVEMACDGLGPVHVEDVP